MLKTAIQKSILLLEEDALSQKLKTITVIGGGWVNLAVEMAWIFASLGF